MNDVEFTIDEIELSALQIIHSSDIWNFHCSYYYPTTIVEDLSAVLAKSGPLDFPSEKDFLLFFAYEKGLGHMFQK